MTQSTIEKIPETKTDSQLLFEINSAKESIARYTKKKKQAETELLFRRQTEIQALLKSKPEPYGDVSIMVGNHKVPINIPKKVSWDQKILSDTWNKMLSDGVRPQDYIKIEYGISETVFKGWDDDMKEYFRAARTVTPGNPTIKLKEEQ